MCSGGLSKNDTGRWQTNESQPLGTRGDSFMHPFSDLEQSWLPVQNDVLR